MPNVIAIHEVHRKSEVIAPGKTFNATDAEYEYLINVGAVVDTPADEAAAPPKANKKANKTSAAETDLDGLE